MLLRSLAIFFFVFSVTFAQSGPKMVLDEGTNINTGNHIRGKEVVYEIKFRNAGDADLKIMGIQTSCGCSSALSTSDLVRPGEAGSIMFSFNGQGYGSVSKSVTIATNETDNFSHVVQLTMNMVEPITTNPQSIITEGRVGDQLTKTATITNSLGKDLDITEVSSNTPVIKVETDKTHIMAGETASLNISIKIFEESAINAAVIIKTTEGDIQIPVLVDVKAN